MFLVLDMCFFKLVVVKNHNVEVFECGIRATCSLKKI